MEDMTVTTCQKCRQPKFVDSVGWIMEIVGEKLCYPPIPIWRVLCPECQ